MAQEMEERHAGGGRRRRRVAIVLGTCALAALLIIALSLRSRSPYECVSVSSEGAQGNDRSAMPSISADGRFVAFQSYASNLVPHDTNECVDVFVHDRRTGRTERVSVSSWGAEADSWCWLPSISADGRFVAFESDASNLVPGDTNQQWDIFVHDRETGLTERVSVSSEGAESNAGSSEPSISADGRFVAFESKASNLVPGDTNGCVDVFVYDRQTARTERASVSFEGAEASWDNWEPAISAHGRFVAFKSGGIFAHDRQTGRTERLSATPEDAEANYGSWSPSISADGRFVAFTSLHTNPVTGDANVTWDVFVHDRETGLTERVSVSSEGAKTHSRGDMPSISADGRFVAFLSDASNLAAGDTSGMSDVFVHDRHTGGTECVSGPNGGDEPALSADGRFVAFTAYPPLHRAPGLERFMGSGKQTDEQIYVYDRGRQE